MVQEGSAVAAHGGGGLLLKAANNKATVVSHLLMLRKKGDARPWVYFIEYRMKGCRWSARSSFS